ncbi:unnamed protein product [Mytilus edulis]|uniref:Uncharacterized protein n=1 Tax=Mytilus edulis TaxID=6550 RepID=A0A8S3T089_MYTED|nr:unnamed protein product [Mytilus edulis]
MPMMYVSMLTVVIDHHQSISFTNPAILSLKDRPYTNVYLVIMKDEIQSELKEVTLTDLHRYCKSSCDNAVPCLIMVDIKNLDVESLKEARQKNAEIHILIADESWKINTQNLIVCVDYGYNINITSLMRDRLMFLKNLFGEEVCNSGVDSSIGRKGSDINVNKSGVGESKGNIDVKN